jgi:uncharacterized membrane protein
MNEIGKAIAIVLCFAAGAGCADEAAAPADEPPAATTAELGARRYHVFKLRGNGGASNGNSINDLAWAAGTALNADGTRVEAALWVLGFKIPLGTLGGPHSAVLWPVKNVRGIISGVSETADDDPRQENWSCAAFFPADSVKKVCRGFVWEGGRMRGLAPFPGGTHSFATGTNNHGHTVGWAENGVEDDSCVAPQQLRFRAALWRRDGAITELPPLAGDPTSAATALNDRGQVVGISGICGTAVGRRSARAAVLWQDGVPQDIGNLGGVAWNTPMAINGGGEVVGFANAPGTVPEDRPNFRAFYWSSATGVRALGELNDGDTSQATGLNDRGQIVGLSCGESCRAVMWSRDGDIVDLNDHVRLPPGDFLSLAGDINDFGVITGEYTRADGSTTAYIAIPSLGH